MNEAFIVVVKFWGILLDEIEEKSCLYSIYIFFFEFFVVGKRTSILVNFDT